MNFKIDTKEKFIVITPEINVFTANMAELLLNEVLLTSDGETNNVIVNMSAIGEVELDAIEILARGKMEIYERGKSFVICCMNEPLVEKIKGWEMDEAINYVPTESEAWDIVQMDEIEREFLKED